MASVKLTKLLAWLNKSPIKENDNALYQTIRELIKRVKDLEAAVNADIAGLTTNISDRTYVTVNNEAPILPNSRRIQAGDHIEIDIGTPGLLIVNSVQFDTTDLTNVLIIELFRYILKRQDLIEELLEIDRDTNDIIVPEELEIVQDDEGYIGIRSMR